MSQRPKNCGFLAPQRGKDFMVPLDRYNSIVYETVILDFQLLIVTMETQFVHHMLLTYAKIISLHRIQKSWINLISSVSNQDRTIMFSKNMNHDNTSISSWFMRTLLLNGQGYRGHMKVNRSTFRKCPPMQH